MRTRAAWRDPRQGIHFKLKNDIEPRVRAARVRYKNSACMRQRAARSIQLGRWAPQLKALRGAATIVREGPDRVTESMLPRLYAWDPFAHCRC